MRRHLSPVGRVFRPGAFRLSRPAIVIGITLSLGAAIAMGQLSAQGGASQPAAGNQGGYEGGTNMRGVVEGTDQEKKLERACPNFMDADVFHKCALEKMKSFTPKMTAWGVPDIRGMWRATATRGQDIEEIDKEKGEHY